MALSKNRKRLVGLAAALTIGSVTAASAAALNVTSTKISAGNSALTEVCTNATVDYTVTLDPATNTFMLENVVLGGTSCTAGTYDIIVSVDPDNATPVQQTSTVVIDNTGEFSAKNVSFAADTIEAAHVTTGNIAVYLNA